MRQAARRTPRAAALAAVVLALPATSAAAQTSAPTTAAAPAAAPAAPATLGTATPAAAASDAPLALTRTETRDLQRKLRVKADGALGPKTRTAIRRKERAYHLRVDGKPDAVLMGKLRLALPQSATSASTSPTSVVPATAPTQGVAPTPAAPAATTGTAAVAPAAPASSVAAAVVAAAQSQIGTPYESGGTAPGGFDCSGLVKWAFAQAGVQLPRTSFDQLGVGTDVPKEQIQAGDIVFFDTAGAGASHDGIATSPTTAISSTTRGVMEHSLVDSYWGGHFVGARRVG
jgi:peptidoglycan DL-endopeptidase CwlO